MRLSWPVCGQVIGLVSCMLYCPVLVCAADESHVNSGSPPAHVLLVISTLLKKLCLPSRKWLLTAHTVCLAYCRSLKATGGPSKSERMLGSATLLPSTNLIVLGTV